MSWRHSERVICLQYRSYSCGRFVSNILSYNNNFLPQYNLDDDVSLSQYQDIKYKHEVILNTIPNQENLKKWRDYELQCYKFYGIKIYDPNLYKNVFHAGSGLMNTKKFTQLLSDIKPRAKDILENTNLFVFIVSHHILTTKLIKEIFPNSLIIEFVNDEYVNTISKKIKTDMPNANVPTKLKEFSKDSYKFDIGTLFCQNEFFDQISKLMDYLKIDNKELDPKVFEYYEKYIDIYKPYLNKEICKK
jgi:hypothetical protein